MTNIKSGLGSPLTSILTVQDIINKSVEQGCEYALLTDYTLAASLEFYRECKSKNIKPIIGLEIGGLIRIALDRRGFKTLAEMSYTGSIVESDSLYCYKPDNGYAAYLSDDDRQYLDVVLMLNNIQTSLTPSKLLVPDIYYWPTVEDYGFDHVDVTLPHVSDLSLRDMVYNLIDGRGFSQEYLDRLEYELNVIHKFGYDEYFLLVHDIIRHTNENLSGYLSAGRGSVGGSLVAYVLGITRVDPIKPDGFDMQIPFDRFINSGRKTMPDIDMDFLPEDRPYIIEYLRYKYGNDRVMHIATVGTLGARAACREVARITGKLTPDIEAIIKSFPNDQSLTLSLVEDSDIYRDSSDEFKAIFQIAKKLEGVPRSVGVHASGIAVAAKPFTDLCVPLMKHPTSGKVITQYTQPDLEYLGIIKLDILGLNTLKNIKATIDLLDGRFTMDQLHNVGIDDVKTYGLVASGLTAGVFQWDTYNYKKLIDKLEPSTYKEFVDLNTLGRSAALLSGLTDKYLEAKQNGFYAPLHDKLTGLMESTYGLPLYQEQIMGVFVALAGYTMQEADDVRKAIGKKIPELMAKHKQMFADRTMANGLTKDDVDVIWSIIDKFSKYTWNIGHALAYTRICYETAYLAANYPVYYYSACAVNAHDAAETQLYISVMRKAGVKVISADINTSGADFKIVDDRTIILGLAGIKKIGDKSLEKLISSRPKGGYYDWKHFLQLTKSSGINKTIIKSLFAAGAFTSFNAQGEIAAYLGMSEDDTMLNQYSISGRISYDVSSIIGVPPISSFRPDLNKYDCYAYLIDHRVIYTKKHEKMAFVTLEDHRGRYEGVIFPKGYADITAYDQLHNGGLYVFNLSFGNGVYVNHGFRVV